MKKIFSIVICTMIFIAAACVLTACKPLDGKDNRSQYHITAAYENGVLTGSLDYELVNTTGNVLKEQQFLLYGQAYRSDAVHPAVKQASAYYGGASHGQMTVSDVKVAGVETTPELLGDDSEIVSVKFRDLYPNEKTIISMSFELQLAKVNHRLGITPHTVNLAQWYPTACPKSEDGAFLAYPYYSIGDPFCTDSADFDIKLTVPSDYKIAASASQTVNDGVYHLQAENMRDFAMVLSPEFTILESQVGNTTVRYCHYNDLKAEESLKIAEEALAYYNNYYQYPYDTYTVAETGFVHGGMEYPGLVLISDAAGEGYPEVIVHETAHQWWYGLVGNDEVQDAWMDEGLTDFMTTLFYDHHAQYGVSRTDRIMKKLAAYLTYVDVYSSLNGQVDTSMNRALNEFKNEQEYTYMTYVKGELMFDTLRTTIGESKFDKALKSYCKHFAHKRATPADMISEFSKAAGTDLEPFFNSWLEGKVALT